MNPLNVRLVALAAGLVTVALSACKEEKLPPPPPRAVMAYEVREETLGGGSFHSGEVRARQESALGFRIAGKLIERKVDMGDTVRPGQILARLDRTDPALAAQAAGNNLAAAEADLELARAEVKRYETLRARNYVSEAALDAKQAILKAADARMQAVRAQAATAGNQTQYADLVADFAGVVSAVTAEPGQVLAAGQPVLRVAKTGGQEKEVLISLAESRVGEFARDSARAGGLVVTMWADSARQYRGKLREISPQADPVTRTYAARIVIANADADVRLGMTATVTAGGSASGVLRVPAAAIVQQGGKPAVWVLGDAGSIALRPVEVAAFREDGAILSAGVRPGERIVAAGGHKLMAGEKVRVLEAR